MKLNFFTILFLILVITTKGQNANPLDLIGTWKHENSNTYERWDKLNENKILGICYKLDNEELVVKEYLEIILNEGNVVYKATVIGQNNGNTIIFKLTDITNDTMIFENSEHEFPNKLTYKFDDKDKIEVTVSGKNNKSFKIKMQKL